MRMEIPREVMEMLEEIAEAEDTTPREALFRIIGCYYERLDEAEDAIRERAWREMEGDDDD